MGFDMDALTHPTWTLVDISNEIWTALTFAPLGQFSLIACLLFAALPLLWLSLASQRRVTHYKFGRVFRVLFNWRFIRQRTHGFDMVMLLANSFSLPLIFGWALLSTTTLAALTANLLGHVITAPTPTTLDPVVVTVISTVAVILAYEFGYWLDHYLCHMVPMLWEFHKVHHAAESLSPLTNFRVHPVDTLVFYNILAVTAGLTIGSLAFAFGAPPVTHPIFNTGNYILIGTLLIGHLQHSHIWIPFTGLLGKLIMSPAHHQIHHSADERHFNKNMGSFLAIFDWMFGTLHMPTKAREKLTFGLDKTARPEHSLTEGLLQPFADAYRHVQPTDVAAQPTGNLPGVPSA
jgi:sterol desaturase/sphingolipid hydroxylase (fatty acid hydroxylase superfamily)